MVSKPTVKDLFLPSRQVYLALFLVSSATILREILLTRIFSVVLFYHYAFMSVSTAMFGLTVGALIILLRKPILDEKTVMTALGKFALSAGILSIISIVIQLSIPLYFKDRITAPTEYLIQTYLLSAIPFIPAGAFTCLVLSRFQNVGKIYAADLTGAAVGCLIFPVLISSIGGPESILVAGAISCFSALVIFYKMKRKVV